jgi:hypothetical protein
MGGDVTGSSNSATVVSIQNIPISTTGPTTGKILQYDGTSWAPADAPQGGSGGGGVIYYFNKGTSVSGGNLPANTYQLGRSAEAAQTSVALTNLATGSWTRVGGFVTDSSDPSVTTVPAGLWDFNLWAYTTAAANNQAYLRLTLYAYNGSTNPESGTALAQTDNVYLYDANVTAQYIASMLIAGGTTLPSTSTRLYLLVEARASTTNRDVTVYFGNGTPSHTHSTIPTVGGTGIVHVIDGVFQTPASPVSLTADVSGVLPLANGGTNVALTATAGGAVYSTGSELAITAAGTIGQFLKSNGASAPTWADVTATAPYDLSGEFVGTPVTSAVVMRFVAARAFTFGGTAQFACVTGPTSTATFTVNVNGVSKGTVTITTSGTSGSGTITSTSIVAGDLITVVATTPAAIVSPYWTLPGTV